MAVTIRLSRAGSTNAPAYRVVVADTRFPRDGRFIEIVGSYDPKRKENNFALDMDRIQHWRAQGAKLSDTVASLIKRAETSETTTA